MLATPIMNVKALLEDGAGGEYLSHLFSIERYAWMALSYDMALAVDMRSGWPARQPSPKKLPSVRMATTACLPRFDTTVSFTLPLSM